MWRGLFFFPETLREAAASALAATGLLSPEAADALAGALVALLAAAIILGVPLLVRASMHRDALETERAQRSAGLSDRSVREPRRRAPVRELLPEDLDADQCAWLLPGYRPEECFEATALRLVRLGLLRLSPAGQDEGGARLALRDLPSGDDGPGRACAEALWGAGLAPGATGRSLMQVLEHIDAHPRGVGTSLMDYRRELEGASVALGLATGVDASSLRRYNKISVAYVLASLALAVWFSTALSSVLTVALFFAGSFVLVDAQRELRRRDLTPAGAQLLQRLELLREALLGRTGTRLGESCELRLSSRDAARLLEFAVVLGLDDAQVAALAECLGERGQVRLLRVGDEVPSEGPVDEPVSRSRRAARDRVRRELRRAGATSCVGALRTLYLFAETRYREEIDD